MLERYHREEIARSVEEFKGRRESNIRIPCPVCAEERGREESKRNLAVSTTTGQFYCWRCHSKGRLSDELCDELAFRSTDPFLRTPAPADAAMALPPEFLPLGAFPYSEASCTEQARAYLAGRKVPAEVIDAANIGCVLDGYWAQRILVPVTADGVCRGWVARSYVPSERTYLYPKGMARGAYLWREEILREQSDDPVLVVEGVFDVLGCWPRAVPVLGKPASGHISKLIAAKCPIVVVLDGDAWEEAWSLAMRLRFEGQRAGAVRMPPQTDPDEVPQDWLREEARRSVTAAL